MAQTNIPSHGSKPPRIVGLEAIAEAAAILREGGIVAVPTETVYGLAARAESDAGVAEIFRAKGRPSFNPLIVHVPDLGAGEALAQFDQRARGLAAAFWPGALTLVLPRLTGAGLSPAVSAGLPTLALRCPAHPMMRALLKECGFPLAAPSANRSGTLSPTSAAHVAASLGERIGLILDGGECTSGIESTIVALRDNGSWSLLRPGPITRSDLAAILGAEHEADLTGDIEAPGQLASHYAPSKPLRLEAVSAQQGEFLIGFSEVAGHSSLSPSGDLAEAAARLYRCLHEADAAPSAGIAVARVPEIGIGAAINDRLRHAAA